MLCSGGGKHALNVGLVHRLRRSTVGSSLVTCYVYVRRVKSARQGPSTESSSGGDFGGKWRRGLLSLNH